MVLFIYSIVMNVSKIPWFSNQIKLRNQIATEQEKLLGEKDQELERLRQDLATTKDNYKKSDDEVSEISSELSIYIYNLHFQNF